MGPFLQQNGSELRNVSWEVDELKIFVQVCLKYVQSDLSLGILLAIARALLSPLSRIPPDVENINSTKQLDVRLFSSLVYTENSAPAVAGSSMIASYAYAEQLSPPVCDLSLSDISMFLSFKSKPNCLILTITNETRLSSLILLKLKTDKIISMQPKSQTRPSKVVKTHVQNRPENDEDVNTLRIPYKLVKYHVVRDQKLSEPPFSVLNKVVFYEKLGISDDIPSDFQTTTCDDRRPRIGLGLPPCTIITH
ncbi:hypothetical protein TNCV_4703941 [Trichonephila clavipes]|nr:hypothetical protein TNCV_4703941 [Trichonephila clavipes]